MSHRSSLSSHFGETGLALLIVVISIFTAFWVSPPATDELLRNTLLLAGLVILSSVPVGIVLAVLLYGTDLPGRHFFRMVLIVMLFMPAYLQVAGWNAGFGLQGWFSRVVLLSEATAPLEGWRGAVFLHAVVALPWVTLILGTGLSRIPRHLTEQTLLEARPLRAFLDTILPLMVPYLIAAAMWILVTTGSEITITDVYQVRTFAEEIYTGFALGDNLTESQSRTLPGVLLIAGLSAAALVACQSLTKSIQPTRLTPDWTYPLGQARWWMGMLIVLTTMVLIALPIGNLLYKAGIEVQQTGETRIRIWSVFKCIRIVAESPGQFSEEFGWSTALGQLTALSVLAISVPLAWFSQSWRTIRMLCWAAVLLGLAIPGPILALGLGRLFNHPDSDWLFYLYDRTLVLPWLALGIKTFPYAFLLAIFAVRQVPERVLEAASLDGAGRIRQLLAVVIPQILTFMASLWILAFAISVGDLSTSILAVPPGVTTVAIRVFNLVHYGVEDQLAGLCLLSVAGFAGIAGFGIWLASIGSDSHR